MIGNKAKFVAFTSAIGLMAIGGVATTSISAQETKTPIEVEVVPVGEPEMIGLVADLTKKLQKNRQDKRSDQNDNALRGVHNEYRRLGKQVAARAGRYAHVRQFRFNLLAERRYSL